MHALVTGGAGFLGSSLVDRLLAEGHAVDVVDDLSTGSLANLAAARAEPGYELNFNHADVRDPTIVDLVARRRPDVVFHLAAQTDVHMSLEHPGFDAEVNVAGSLNVIEGARRGGAKKVVFASSDAIYAPSDLNDPPVREGHPRRPRSPFGVSKNAVGDYLQTYRDVYDLEFTALAFGHVYGPRQLPAAARSVVATFTHGLLTGAATTIYGTGHQTRDFVFVDDAVDACARAGDRGGGLLINVSTGVATSIVDLHRTVAAVTGRDEPPVMAPPRVGDVMQAVLDPGRAAIHLGWRAWTSLTEGVAAVAAWMADNPRDSVV